MAHGCDQGWRAQRKRVLVLGALGTAAVMSGCVAVSSQAVGPSPSVRSYELRASNMQEVVAEAERLCPKGYEVHRSSGRNDRLAGEPQKPFNFAAKAWNHAVGWLDTDTDCAQLAVTCL
jgi:hypothetical protein